MGERIIIFGDLAIPEDEVEFTAVRAQGAGGQHVNKSATAAHLRFDIVASSLPDRVKARLRALPDRRISSEGVVVIKAQETRSLEQNRRDALDRLCNLVREAAIERMPRRKTRPSRAAIRRRLDTKTRRGATKTLRRKPTP